MMDMTSGENNCPRLSEIPITVNFLSDLSLPGFNCSASGQHSIELTRVAARLLPPFASFDYYLGNISERFYHVLALTYMNESYRCGYYPQGLALS